ncbi:hypothetical protein SAMN05421766_101526 [Zobellia uliginosa]|uniref:Uncharacterized protein n=1 Tax=Zobellia uliginosa TaxID=143224 RepID=A0ABY1KLI2_9FLAO|nr:hypothetical protein SAMN05421766_101526 [Zobellia uliginosa]
MQKYWGLFLIVLLSLSCKDDRPVLKEPVDKELAVVVPEKPVMKQFGFNLDEFTVQLDTVKNGDSFGELMLQHKVEYPKIAKITQDFKDTFDVRKIRVGKPYLILKSKDTTEAAQVFIYENDAINYTVVDLRDTVKAYKDKKEVTYVEREASGVIETSLSQAILIKV